VHRFVCVFVAPVGLRLARARHFRLDDQTLQCSVVQPSLVVRRRRSRGIPTVLSGAAQPTVEDSTGVQEWPSSAGKVRGVDSLRDHYYCESTAPQCEAVTAANVRMCAALAACATAEQYWRYSVSALCQ
jgi:hypothetical protein